MSTGKPMAVAEQSGVEVELPPNVYEFDGVTVKLLEPAKVKATHEAHNERLLRLVEDKSGAVRAKSSMISDSAVQDQISEIKTAQRQQMTVNETILARLSEFGAKLDASAQAKVEKAKN